MRYVLYAVLIILSAVIIILMAALWSLWQIYLRMDNKNAVIELRGFGIKKKLVDICFEDKSKQPKKDKPQSGKKKKKSQAEIISDKIKSDRNRIYNSDDGLNIPEFKAVAAEYKAAYKKYKNIILDFFGDLRYKLSVPLLRIDIDIGLDNPTNTGMAYSSIWGIVGITYPLLTRYMHIVYPTISVTPDFYGKRFRLDAESIIKVRPAHIINALVKQGLRAGITNFTINKKGSVKNG